jgi:hypothetical protein
MLSPEETMQTEVWSPANNVWVFISNIGRLAPGDIYRFRHPSTEELTGPWLVLKHPEVQCQACEEPTADNPKPGLIGPISIVPR